MPWMPDFMAGDQEAKGVVPEAGVRVGLALGCGGGFGRSISTECVDLQAVLIHERVMFAA